MSGEELAAWIAGLPAERQPQDSQQLARELDAPAERQTCLLEHTGIVLVKFPAWPESRLRCT